MGESIVYCAVFGADGRVALVVQGMGVICETNPSDKEMSCFGASRSTNTFRLLVNLFILVIY
jgi:hypothetical protein